MSENRTSCNGCIHDLGGGYCEINAEKECREGGGFELYGQVNPPRPRQCEIERLGYLLTIERHLHKGTKRKLEKAEHDKERYARRLKKLEHDRERYAKRIRFLDGRNEVMCREYRAAQVEIHALKTAVTALEGRLKAYEQGAEKGAAENGAPAEEAATGVHEAE